MEKLGMSDLAYSSGTEIARRIRHREISSREAVDYFLARVESLDKRINSIVTIDSDRARHEADAADAALARGEVKGPLHGVPMTIKDSFQTEGMRTTSGAPELATFIPSEDAWPVARLREAGAIIFGKTNLPIYAGDLGATTKSSAQRTIHTTCRAPRAAPPADRQLRWLAALRLSNLEVISAARFGCLLTCQVSSDTNRATELYQRTDRSPVLQGL
jgi:Asp-tRNA(Asn)/Glu-tRNA(Gln) amidotransferase A subunit family amidase